MKTEGRGCVFESILVSGYTSKMKKKALVTGASGGIGEAFARALARDGYTVTAVARSEEKLQALTASLVGEGHRHEVADLTKGEDVERIATLFASEHYTLLVNNAGAGWYEPFAEAEITRAENVVSLNISSVVALSHAFLRHAERGDALLNVASILGLLPYPTGAVYAASKAFVLSFSEALWYEQKGRGVYVQALCPGVTASNFHVAAGGAPHEQPSAWLTQSAEEVVDEALTAIERRAKPTVVANWKNKVMLLFARFLSRKRVVLLTGKW